MKQAIRAVTALVATALFGLGVAVVPLSPASAATWDEWMYTDDDNPGGRVQFQAYGDIMRVCDIQADGYSVVLSVSDWTTQTFKYEYTVGGNGNCEDLRASLGGPYDLAERHVFWVRVALVKNGYWYFQDEAFWMND